MSRHVGRALAALTFGLSCTFGPNSTLETAAAASAESRLTPVMTSNMAEVEAAPAVPIALTSNADDIDWSNAYVPRWSARVGTVILQRGGLPSQLFVYDSATNQNYIDPSNFNFPWRGGLDAGAMFRGEFADVDFRYFGVESWYASQGPILAAAGVTAAFPNLGPSPDPILVSTGYTTRLHSAEINLRKNVTHRWSLLGGFRYLSFSDGFLINADNGPGIDTTQIGVNAGNQLFGAQIGADGILYDNGRRFHIESAIKAGVYGNGAKNTLQVGDGAGNTFILGSVHRNHTAFVGDLNFTGVYQLTDHINLRAGYQLLWLAGVAVGSEQPPSIDFNNGNISVDTSGSAFFHGVLLSAETTW